MAVSNQAEIDARKSELEAELAEINQAIKDIYEVGQEYSLSDRRYRGATITDLTARRKEIRQALQMMIQGHDGSFRPAVPGAQQTAPGPFSR